MSDSAHGLNKQSSGGGGSVGPGGSGQGAAGPGSLLGTGGFGGTWAGDSEGGGEYVNVAAKTLDLDEIDKETLHLLIFLFMQFLSHTEHVSPVNNLS